MILDNLPGDSAYMTAARDALTPERWTALAAKDDEPEVAKKYGRWSRSDFLTARVGDLIAQLIWFQSDRKTPAPEPLSRPGINTVKPMSAEAFEYLSKVRELRGGDPNGV